MEAESIQPPLLPLRHSQYSEGRGRFWPIPGRHPEYIGGGFGLGILLSLLQRLQVLTPGRQQTPAALRRVPPPRRLDLRRSHSDSDKPHLGH